MSRTRLRGLEIAGIQIGIEVPKSCSWQWADEDLAEFACLPRNPEVHVGVRVGDVGTRDLGGERYAMGAWTFEVARQGDDWLLGLTRAGAREQLALFDQDFRTGEIIISSHVAGRGGYPLQSPLDEWIVLHRNVARGGLCLSGAATADRGRARVRLGTGASPTSNRWSASTLFGRNTLWLCESEGDLRIHRTPWADAMDHALGFDARVLELEHAEESTAAFSEVLDPDEAAEILVAHAVVPLCDDALLERVLQNARKLAELVPFRRIGEPFAVEAPMSWQSTQLQGGFAPPRSLA